MLSWFDIVTASLTAQGIAVTIVVAYVFAWSAWKRARYTYAMGESGPIEIPKGSIACNWCGKTGQGEVYLDPDFTTICPTCWQTCKEGLMARRST